ncbi:MAG: four helix bundle protein [Patescibacteria group bacterium]
MIKSYRDLIVWQKAVKASLGVYQITSTFPKSEMFGLTSQMRRAAVSIPSNIAEGRSRNTRKDFTQFLRIAHGSTAELQTQLEIARELSFVSQTDYNKLAGILSEISRMLNSIITKLRAPNLTASS